jgi:PAS domain-containing protein
MNQPLPGLEFFTNILNAVPSPLFVVDDDVQILYLNSAAAGFLGKAGENAFMKRSGEALHCLHAAEHPEGCGHAAACSDCVIRNSVKEAFQGRKVTRKKIGMTLDQDTCRKDIQMLVTASPFRFEDRMLSLLILEDITELLQLRSLLPICAWCKKIRNDDNYWQSVEEYFSDHLDLEFSHGLCEDCCKKHFSELSP